MAELIGERYSAALFQAGEDLNKIEDFYEQANLIKENLEKEPKLMDLLTHPKINKKEKKEIIDNIFARNLDEEMLNFIYILIDKNREKYLLNIIDEYENLYFESKGLLRVIAVTVGPMKEEAKERLRLALKDKLNKEIVITNVIDEDIIGGVKLEIEGKLIDGTIKGKLDSISKLFNTATN